MEHNSNGKDLIRALLGVPMCWSASSLALWTNADGLSTAHLLFIFNRLPLFRRALKTEKDNCLSPSVLYKIDIITRDFVNRLSGDENTPDGLQIMMDDILPFVDEYGAIEERYGCSGEAFLRALDATDSEIKVRINSEFPEFFKQAIKIVSEWEERNQITVYGDDANVVQYSNLVLYQAFASSGKLTKESLEKLSRLQVEYDILSNYWNTGVKECKFILLNSLYKGRILQFAHVYSEKIYLPMDIVVHSPAKQLEHTYAVDIYGDEVVDLKAKTFGIKSTIDTMGDYDQLSQQMKLPIIWERLHAYDSLSYIDTIAISLVLSRYSLDRMIGNKKLYNRFLSNMCELTDLKGATAVTDWLKDRVRQNGELARYQLKALNALKASGVAEVESVVDKIAEESALKKELVSELVDDLLYDGGKWGQISTTERNAFNDGCIKLFFKYHAVGDVKDLGEIIETKDKEDNSLYKQLKEAIGDSQEKGDTNSTAQENDGIEMPFGETYTKAQMQKWSTIYVKQEKELESALLEIISRNRKNVLFLNTELGSGVSMHLKQLISKQFLGGKLVLNGNKLIFCMLPVLSMQANYPAHWVYSTAKKMLEDFGESYSDGYQVVAVYENVESLCVSNPVQNDCYITELVDACNQVGAKLLLTCNNAKYAKFNSATQRMIDKQCEVFKLTAYNEEETLKTLDYTVADLEGFYFLSAPVELKAMAVKYAKLFYSSKPLVEVANDLVLKAFSKASLRDSGFVSKAVVGKGGKLTMDIGALHTVVRLENNLSERELTQSPYEVVELVKEKLKGEVFGQEEAINQFIKQWKISKSGLREEHRPECVMMFIGQTGVGKTELATQIAEATGKKLLRFDMSEYNQAFSTSSLLGSASGYIGYNDGGILTNAVKESPNCVLLLDEIEKAHQDVHNLLLQVMSNAELTSNNGTKVDFQKAIIIMTSNVGASALKDQKVLGFNSKSTDNDDKEIYTKALRDKFTPEFLGRPDDIVHFKALTDDVNKQILRHKWDKLVSSTIDRYSNIIEVKMGNTLFDRYLSSFKDNKAGARGAVKQMNTEVLEPLCDALLQYGIRKEFSNIKQGDAYKLRLEYNEKEDSVKVYRRTVISKARGGESACFMQ